MAFNNYISHIDICNLRNTPPCKINLSDDKRTYLIVTGPNGCGKTTFANALSKTMNFSPTSLSDVDKELKKAESEGLSLEAAFSEVHSFYKRVFIDTIADNEYNRIVKTDLTQEYRFYIERVRHNFIVYTSEAHRKGIFSKPSGPSKLPERSSGEKLEQVLVNLDSRSAYIYRNLNRTKDEKERAELKCQYDAIDIWFNNFKNALKELLGHDSFELVSDEKNFNFMIHEDGKEPYDLSQLSDGYSAILKIVSDLMLSMSTDPVESYETPGVAIIDEIETHLHVALQRKIMPFLTKLFPNIQFIVTTHSPFILSSIDNAVIFDMASYNTYRDFSQYSYSNIIEDYFDESQYSESILEKLRMAVRLISKEVLSEEEKQIINDFDKYVNSKDKELCTVPEELKAKWNEVKLANFDKYHGFIQ